MLFALRSALRPRGSLPAGTAAALRSLFVKIDATPNPDSLKFVPEGTEVLPAGFGTGVHFADEAAAGRSRLARRLLRHPQITGVFMGPDFISVNKREDDSWGPLKPIVLDAIMDALAERDAGGAPLVEAAAPAGGAAGAAAPADGALDESDSEVVAMIKELLETRIRPAVQEDGGDIFFVAFDEATGVVKLRMAGSCVGCPSSTATLRNGVENMLAHYIPEVRGVEQVKGPLEEAAEAEVKALEGRLGDGA